MNRAIKTFVLSAALVAPIAYAQDNQQAGSSPDVIIIEDSAAGTSGTDTSTDADTTATDTSDQSAGTSGMSADTDTSTSKSTDPSVTESTESMDTSEQAGEAKESAGTMGRTEQESADVTQGVFAAPFTFTPRIGAIGYGETNGDYASRATGGFTLDWLVPNIVDKTSKINVGLETGFMYTHAGATGSNFFGTDAPSTFGGQAGTNAFLVPINLAAGYKVSDAFLINLLAGANLIYRSNAAAMPMGRGDVAGDESADFFPSVGLNAGWALGKSVALSLRGDYIPTPRDDVFTATIGAMIPIG